MKDYLEPKTTDKVFITSFDAPLAARWEYCLTTAFERGVPFGWESQVAFNDYFLPQIKQVNKKVDLKNFPPGEKYLNGVKIKRLDAEGPFAPFNQYLTVPNRPIKSWELDGQTVIKNGIPFALPVVQCYAKDIGEVKTTVKYNVTTQSQKITLYNLRPWNLPFELRKLVFDDGEIVWWDPAKKPHHREMATHDISEVLSYLRIGSSSTIIYKIYEVMDPENEGERDFLQAVKKAVLSIIKEKEGSSGLSLEDAIKELSDEFPAVTLDFILSKVDESKDIEQLKKKVARSQRSYKAIRLWAEDGSLVQTFNSVIQASLSLNRSREAIYSSINRGSAYHKGGRKFYLSRGDDLPSGIPELAQTFLRQEKAINTLFKTHIPIAITSLTGQVLSGSLKGYVPSKIAKTLNITEEEVEKLYEIALSSVNILGSSISGRDTSKPAAGSTKFDIDAVPYFDPNLSTQAPHKKHTSFLKGVFHEKGRI